MKPIVFLLLALVLFGCAQNRSISSYRYDYNSAYKGELSQIGFLKDVSDPNTQAKEEHFAVKKTDKIMIIQSGQAYPDSELLSVLPKESKIVPISGIPENGNIDRIPLRSATKTGNIDFVLGFWGTIRNTGDNKMIIVLSAILANPREGTWKYLEVSSQPEPIDWSFFDRQKTDDLQIQRIKQKVYFELATKIYGFHFE